MRYNKGVFTGEIMRAKTDIFLGIDCGATTSKVGGIYADGSIISGRLRQCPTASEDGPEAIIANWLKAAQDFLDEGGFHWDNVAGVGLAIPGPYLAYGVLGPMPNMPASLTGWCFLDALRIGIRGVAAREIRVETANDGLLAGLGEAKLIQRDEPGSVLMLAPGTGLGSSYINIEGNLPLGDHQASTILCHMPAPYHILGLPIFRCGCGRDWGCFEAYTSISGLPQLLDYILPKYKEHPLSHSSHPIKKIALSLRGLAQSGDRLALEIFDIQATILGYAVAVGCMAFDPSHVVIGGGLMDKESTSKEFRARYIQNVRKTAIRYAWVDEDKLSFREAKLGDLSQAIGAALYIKSKLWDG